MIYRLVSERVRQPSHFTTVFQSDQRSVSSWRGVEYCKDEADNEYPDTNTRHRHLKLQCDFLDNDLTAVCWKWIKMSKHCTEDKACYLRLNIDWGNGAATQELSEISSTSILFCELSSLVTKSSGIVKYQQKRSNLDDISTSELWSAPQFPLPNNNLF